MIKAIYLDLGKVIVDFDHAIPLRSLAKHSSRSLVEMQSALGKTSAIVDYELGRISRLEFWRRMCEALQMPLSQGQFEELWNSLFLPTPLISDSLLQSLRANYRLFLLSNTNEIHFEFILQRYSVLRHIEAHILSYRVGCMKPDPKIYQIAIERSGVLPEEIFFTDDRVENVDAARQAGIRAVAFSSEEQLTLALEENGISLV